MVIEDMSKEYLLYVYPIFLGCERSHAIYCKAQDDFVGLRRSEEAVRDLERRINILKSKIEEENNVKKVWTKKDESRKIAYLSYEKSVGLAFAVIKKARPSRGISNFILKDKDKEGNERFFYTPLLREDEKDSPAELHQMGDWCFTNRNS